MKTIEIKLYSYEELSNEAKQKALNKYAQINVECDWWQSTYEEAENIGLKLIFFDLDRNRHATGKFLLAANEVAQNILNEHGAECETYKTAQSFLNEWQPVFNNYMDETHENYESKESEDILSELETDFLNSLLEDYSIMLQKECEYLQSEEAILETFTANDYTFEENGKMRNI